MKKALHHLLPAYAHCPPARPSWLLRTGGLLALAGAFGFWFFFNMRFFGAPVVVPFSACLGLWGLLVIGLPLWPLFFLLQALLLLALGGSSSTIALLLLASYVDFWLLGRSLDRIYQRPDISAFTPRTILTLLAPCGLGFGVMLFAVFWLNAPNWTLLNFSSPGEFLGLLFLLGLLERAVGFGLLFGHVLHRHWQQQIPRILVFALGLALYAYLLRAFLGYSPAWVYTLFLIVPAFIIPFAGPLMNSSWASLAAVVGMLLALLTLPIEAMHTALLSYNLIAILLLTTLIQNGFAILRATFGSLRQQEQQVNRRIREVLDIAPILACSYDRDGRIHFWNKECENTLGWSLSELQADQQLFGRIFPTASDRDKYAFPPAYRDTFTVWHPLDRAALPRQILWGSFPISESRYMGIGIDLGKQMQAKLQLERTRQHYIEILKKIPIGVFTLRQKGPKNYQFDFVSPFFAEIIGIPVHTILGDPMTVFNLWLQDHNRGTLLAAKKAFKHGQGFCIINRLRIQGEYRWIKAEFNVNTLDTGERIANGVLIDITEEREQTRRLSISGMVLQEMQEGLLILDAQLQIIHCNPAIDNLTGYRCDELLNQPVYNLFTEQGRLGPNSKIWQRIKQSESWHGEIIFYTKDHSKKYLQVFMSRVKIPFEQPEQFIVMLSDITPYKTREEKLIQIANFDLLTGLATRRLLYDRLNQAIAYTARNRQVLAICYLDLNDFKQINDRFGHKAGDQLLTEFSTRLRSGLRKNDTAGRIGGDEIVILLPNLNKPEDTARVLQKLLAFINEPYLVLGRYRVQVSASIGVNFFDARHYAIDTPLPTASELIQQADQAMYVAKAKGDGIVHYHDAEADTLAR